MKHFPIAQSRAALPILINIAIFILMMFSGPLWQILACAVLVNLIFGYVCVAELIRAILLTGGLVETYKED